MGALAISDLAPMAGEPRVQDMRLGEVLGFDRPRKVRDLISRNLEELGLHGLVYRAAIPIRSGKGRIQHVDTYWLNEAQALLVCMFARTEKAAQVRSQVISVFMAWRRGELVEAAHAPDPAAQAMARLEARLAALEGLGRQLEALLANPLPAAHALTHSDSLFGHMKWQRRPVWWQDTEVRGAVLTSHRQMTLNQARAAMIEAFGEPRAPSRSSIHRFWMRLDRLNDRHLKRIAA